MSPCVILSKTVIPTLSDCFRKVDRQCLGEEEHSVLSIASLSAVSWEVGGWWPFSFLSLGQEETPSPHFHSVGSQVWTVQLSAGHPVVDILQGGVASAHAPHAQVCVRGRKELLGVTASTQTLQKKKKTKR